MFEFERFMNLEFSDVSGVMSFVGKVIEEHSQNLKEKNKKEKEPNPNKRANPDPVLIGFVPWSIVRYRVNLDIKNGWK